MVPQVRAPHDDDDGRRGGAEDQVEAAVAGGDHRRPGQEDPRPDGRQGGAEAGQAGGHRLLHPRHRHGDDRGVPAGGLPSRLPLVLPDPQHAADDAEIPDLQGHQESLLHVGFLLFPQRKYNILW